MPLIEMFAREPKQVLSADVRTELARMREQMRAQRTAATEKPASEPSKALLQLASMAWIALPRLERAWGMGHGARRAGATPADGSRIAVDHILPVRRHWHLRLEAENLQVLCNDCNLAKDSNDVAEIISRAAIHPHLSALFRVSPDNRAPRSNVSIEQPKTDQPAIHEDG